MRSSPWQASPDVAERAVGRTDFRILGPVGVTVGGRPLVIGGARNRAVLAALLLSAGRVVSIDQLVEATWGPHPPTGARSQIQNRISKLRGALEPVPATGGLIRTVGGGYVIRPGADELDQDRFSALTALADRLLATGDPAGAAQALGRALDLRSGPALDGLGTPYLSSAAHGIEERFLVAFERLMQLHLLLGWHAQVIGELRCMADAHPIREQLHALLMLALFRDGRLAEALDVYRTVRAALVDQFGLEPGATLQALNDAMLRSDPRLLTAALDGVLAITTAARTAPPHPAPHTAPPVPRELPAAAPLLAGRAEQLRRLDELAARPGGATGRAGSCDHTMATAATVVITGAPGTGKTALAVHWGHRVGGEFPDGQLHLDLRGYGSEPPLPPLGALTALLRSLDAVGYEPEDVAAAATRYRSMMAERRMLVLLDNAASAEQVQPLLPGGPGNQVIVTSRDRLSGLVAMNGARRLTLGALDPPAAEGLLIGLIGEARANAERDAVRALAEACASLPMALRIAATSLMDHPHRRIDELVRDLRAHSGLRNVAEAGPGWADLERSYDLSYMTLPAPARRLLQLIGAVGESEISAESAAALAGIAPASARELLDVLSAGHLIEERAENRFGLNGLLRRYAVDRCNAESSDAERDAARQRLRRHVSRTETAPNPSSWPSMADRWRDQKESMAAQAIMRRTTVPSR